MFCMSDMNHLNDQLRQLAKSFPERADSSVEQRVVREFRADHRRRRRKWMYVAQAAALVVLLFALSFLVMRNAHHAAPATARNGAQEFDPSAFTGFVPLPYADSGVPLGESVVMRVQLRASDLTALGVSVPPGNTRQQFGADVLIGQDGVARAVRFLQ
jgi:hypothetical protein